MPEGKHTFAEHFMELSVVAVLVAVPLFVIPYSALPFEEAKVSLLRTAAMMCLPFSILTLIRNIQVAGGRRNIGMQAIPPLIIMVCFFGYSLLLSTFFSVSPSDSFFGAQLRRQGTYTIFCYLFFFFVVIGTVRTHRQIERMLLAVLLTGFVVSFWGILQYLGVYQLDGFQKPSGGTFGNRLFLPAFLIMCIPINLYFLMRSFKVCGLFQNHGPHHRPRLRVCFFFLVNMLCLTINLFVIVMAQKRGPLLGLGVGLFLFIILYLMGCGKRKTAMSVLGGGSFFAVLILWIGMTGHRYALSAHIPLVNTLTDSFYSGTGLVRLYIWKGVLHLLASNPIKWALGYGPEMLARVLPVYNFSILKQIESPTAIADRAHNETLDLLVMQGFLGTTAFLAIFGIIGYHVLRRLGFINSSVQRRVWGASLLCGCSLGCLIPKLISGNWTFSGMGLGIGLVGGCFLYLGWFITRAPKGSPPPWDSRKLLLSLLLTAMTAHFIEIQFSFGITATRLYYWVLAGMAIVAGSVKTEAGQRCFESQQTQQLELPPPAYPAILAVFSIITVSFGFLCFGQQDGHFFYGVLASHVGTIILCWSFFKPASAIKVDQQRFWLNKNFIFLMVSLSGGCLYYVSYFFLESAMARGLHSFLTQSIYTVLEKNIKLACYMGWFLGLLFLGTFLMLLERFRYGGIQKMYGLVWLFPLLVLLVLPVVIRSNLLFPMADIYTKAGDESIGLGNWNMAHTCFEKAIALEPDQAWRYQKLGHLFFIQAKNAPEPQKKALYQEALLQTEKATHLAPLDVTLKNNLARMSAAWAAQAGDERSRLYRLMFTQKYYRKALKADPNNPFLWKEAGQLSASMGNIQRAIKQFLRALGQQPDDFESHRNLAILYRVSGQIDEAMTHARKALCQIKRVSGPDIDDIRTLISALEQTKDP
jgi:tetratricopeptide (TPR) repeat protein/O-antigen ligase